MSLAAVGIGIEKTCHSERKLEKHEQRDRREDDIRSQGSRRDVGCSCEGTERDEDWKKLSI